MKTAFISLVVGVAYTLTIPAQVPHLISYQGRVAVNQTPFSGAGYFKFALVNANGTATYWTHAGSTGNTEPSTAVELTVDKGLYSVLLGDTTLSGMQAITPDVFNHSPLHLRVWFSDGVHGSQQLAPDQPIVAVGYALIAATVADQAITASKIAHAAIANSHLQDGSVSSAKLSAGAAVANLNASGQSGIASGGLVLSATENPALVNAGYVRLGTTSMGDTWQQRVNGTPPSARLGHTAIWTGSEMIIWGGYIGSTHVKSGSHYNPAANHWTALPDSDAPAGRRNHTAVWTGNEMIVWGGYIASGSDPCFNNGGRYNPTSRKWSPLSTSGAPSARRDHTAVWTGSEMVLWGGRNGESFYHDGKRYRPLSDTWVDLLDHTSLELRSSHTAVWTGQEMIIWGGYCYNGGDQYFQNGGRYNPANNTWTAMTTANAPTARGLHSAIWTGQEMIIWGGSSGSALGTGGRYQPATDSWTTTASDGSPVGRQNHVAVWTGSEMLIYGGYNGPSTFYNDGARYHPISNSWTALPSSGAPEARYGHTAVWTGSEMLVWGGHGQGPSQLFNEGGRFNPTVNHWLPISTMVSLALRSKHTAVWTGSEMVIWGGWNGSAYFNDGSRYDPAINQWRALPVSGLSGRYGHSAVWTGSEMIIWGGGDSGTIFTNGSAYNPAGHTWVDTPHHASLSARQFHAAVWTDQEMIIWGGVRNGTFLKDGHRYNPSTRIWTSVNTTTAPTERSLHTAVWTGSVMIIWGGFNNGSYLDNGGRYNPAGNSWSPMSTVDFPPSSRDEHTAVWTGTEMIVWGGAHLGGQRGDGGRYNPALDRWISFETTGAPSARRSHSAIWTGSEMIIWGGYGGSSGSPIYLNNGARYNPNANIWLPMTANGLPTARSEHTAVWTGHEMIIWGGQGANATYLNDTWTYTAVKTLFLYIKP